MATLAEMNKKRWDAMRIPASMGPAFKKAADQLSAPEAQARYKAVEKLTGVPWWFIGVVHIRESNQNWAKSLAQGDPWNKKSVRVPKGRGPFKSWEEAAVDALTNCHPFAAKNKDWSIGGSLAMLEKYNGLGYYNKGIPSPYIWAGTDQYVKGKYIADGKFDANHVDKQLGCAGILKFMGVFNKTGPIIAASATATSTVVYAYTYWDHIVNHWIIYSSATAVVLSLVGLMIYAYKHKDQPSAV